MVQAEEGRPRSGVGRFDALTFPPIAGAHRRRHSRNALRLGPGRIVALSHTVEEPLPTSCRSTHMSELRCECGAGTARVPPSCRSVRRRSR